MVMENIWNKEAFYSKKFGLSPTGTEMLRGELNTLEQKKWKNVWGHPGQYGRRPTRPSLGNTKY
jgi:hypothetical protein